MTSIPSLLSLMARLRDRETGCPWDIEQNFASIAPHTLEEAYEVVDAITRNDMPHLKEELGDLLLQVVFHAQMAKEIGAFTFEDVVTVLCEKLISRHPHIFGDAVVKTAAEQTKKWEEIKQKERELKAVDKGKKTGILADIPTNLPALMRASKLQKRAAKAGFNWSNLSDLLDKLEEEISELKSAVATEKLPHIKEEIGDIFFVLCNLCNHFDIAPDAALLATNQKFERRFQYVEEKLREQNKTPETSTLEEMDAFWNEIRKQEKTE